MKKLILLASMCLLVHSSLYAQQGSNVISYQGLIQGVNGASVKDSTYSVSISMWTNATGGTQLWQDVFQTPVKDGIFNIMLGSQVPLPASADMDRPLWLSVNVGGSSGAVPRSQLSAVPMAMNVADSSITTQKMATDYVSAVTVNGTPITSRGGTVNFESGDGVQFSFDSSTNSVYAQIPPAPQSQLGDDHWGEHGNFNISVPQQFVGTIDTSSVLEVHLEDGSGGSSTPNIVRVARFQFDPTSPNITMGYGSGGRFGNSITGSGSTIAGGGETEFNNYIVGNFDFIGGGVYSTIWSPFIDPVDYSVVVGGSFNSARASHCFVGGGYGNGAGSNPDDSFAVVVGGYLNWAKEEYSGIVGGDSNYIFSPYGFIGGGQGNFIQSEDKVPTDARYSSIVGGTFNTIGGRYNFIGGGSLNTIYTDVSDSLFSSITGGKANTIRGLGVEYGFIGAGDSNSIHASTSAIVGGLTNKIDTLANLSFIGDGEYNTIDTSATYSFNGGGRQNLIQGPWCVISGGDSNRIYNTGADHNVIGGGLDNIEQNPSFGVIGGGLQNVLDSAAWGSTIGGGVLDSIQAALSFIGGGNNNAIYFKWIEGATIVGGQFNKMWYGQNSFIGGGEGNQDISNVSVIVGGDSNTLAGGSDYGFIGGGQHNIINAVGKNATIGGGSGNYVYGNNACIPGGDSLFTYGYAQTMIGYHNAINLLPGIFTKGTPHKWTVGGIQDLPLFAAGNGDAWNRPSNAAEISYDGHIIVYDSNGTGGAETGANPATSRPYIYGGVYGDNGTVAWADVQAGPPHGPMVRVNTNSDFGVDSISHPDKGKYIVVLNVTGPDGNNVTLTGGSVTVTVEDSPTESNCYFATSTAIVGNQFTIQIHNAADCTSPPEGNAFMFKVCARGYVTPPQY